MGEVRAAKTMLHELEERDARVRAAKNDLEESLKLRIPDALSVSIQRVREDEYVRDEVDLKV